METLPRLTTSARLLPLLFVALLLPRPVLAQPALVVTPSGSANPVVVQATVGVNPPSQTVQVTNSGNRALKWSVAQPTPDWFTVSPISGGNNGTLTLTFKTSTKPAGQLNGTFVVQSPTATTGSPATVYVQVNISGTAPKLTVTCPSNITVNSSDGSPVVVTYSVSTSIPATVTGSPASGSSFQVGTTAVQVTAQSSDGQTASCGFSVTVTSSAPSGDWTFCAWEGATCAFTGTMDVRYGTADTFAPVLRLTNGTPCTNEVFGDPAFGAFKHCDIRPTTTSPPPSSSVRGPQSTITCPSGSVFIQPGSTIPYIQSLIDTNPGATTFCFRVGVHDVDLSIIPKTGNTFVGEYGAILDGSKWATTNGIDAAFKADNRDIDNVTIRNLVIRKLQRGIHALGSLSSNWTIEYNEIAFNQSGLVFPSSSLIKNNYIHDNPLGGYMGVAAHNSLIENNEIALNGWEQKIALSQNITFRNNFIHHNSGAGIWFDTDNTNALVENNRVEDSGWIAIDYEVSSGAIIRNNIIRRAAVAGVFLATSKNNQIYNNTFENNFRAINYFLNCAAVGGGSIPGGWDLADNRSYDNIITVGPESGALANVFSYHSASECGATQVAPYKNGSKNLTFTNNTYDVPSVTGQYWYWDGLYTFTGWQGLGHDTTGSVK